MPEKRSKGPSGPPLKLPFTRENLDKLARWKAGKRLSLFKDERDKIVLDRLNAGKQFRLTDESTPGFTCLVTPPTERKPFPTMTFRAAYYLPSAPGRARYQAIGRYTGTSKIDDYRNAAEKIRVEAKGSKLKKPIDPKEEKLPERFGDLVPLFMETRTKLKHADELQRQFDTYILPYWRDKKMMDISSPDTVRLHDRIANKKVKGKNGRMLGGETIADRCLATLSTYFKWYKRYEPDFQIPLADDMKKVKASERKRQRSLNGFEIRALWKATAEMGVYGEAVRTMLLTGQRRSKVTNMRRSDIQNRLIEGREIDGQWIDDFWIENVWNPIKGDEAENKNASVVPLSEKAVEIINNVPIINQQANDYYIFSLNGKKPINGFSKFKKQLDELMRAELAKMKALPENENADPDLFALKPWVLHDLRRTVHDLMGRAGVPFDIRERCLGHALGGIRSHYDVYDYIVEKREAFARLAAHIERIINPPERANVIDMKAGKRAS